MAGTFKSHLNLIQLTGKLRPGLKSLVFTGKPTSKNGILALFMPQSSHQEKMKRTSLKLTRKRSLEKRIYEIRYLFFDTRFRQRRISLWLIREVSFSACRF